MNLMNFPRKAFLCDLHQPYHLINNKVGKLTLGEFTFHYIPECLECFYLKAFLAENSENNVQHRHRRLLKLNLSKYLSAFNKVLKRHILSEHIHAWVVRAAQRQLFSPTKNLDKAMWAFISLHHCEAIVSKGLRLKKSSDLSWVTLYDDETLICVGN